MKKILNIFASITLVAIVSTGVVGCSSPQKTSTDQNLYNQLNGKKITIQDNNFWGNEANYQQDLLKDIEQLANISSQDDNLLSFDDGIKPLSPNDSNDISIVIDHNQIAHMVVKWVLTQAQTSIYDFYDHVWPQEIKQYQQKISNLDDVDAQNASKTGWIPGYKNTISWNDFGNLLNNKSFKGGLKLIPPEIYPYFQINDVGINSLKVSESYHLTTSLFSLKIGDVIFNLPYYNYSSITSSNKVLPKAENWTIGYDTNYDILQKIKIGLKSNPIAFGKEGLQQPYTAENSYNSEVIKGYIEGLYPSYTNIISDLTFSGDLKAGTKDKPYTNTINVYFPKIKKPQFTIPVEVVSLPKSW